MRRNASRPRSLRRLGLAAAVATGLAWASAPPATAATAVESGWWSSVPVTAPDAHAGLLVQGGVADPTAYAAVRYQLAPGEQVVGLTLTVAEGSATTPGSTLRACPLTQGFQPGTAQSMEQAPDYDCRLEIESTASADGTSFGFDLRGWEGGEALGVAVLPSSATDRVVLQAPEADAVESTAPTTGDEPTAEPPSTGDGRPTASGSDASPTRGGATGPTEASAPSVTFEPVSPAAPAPGPADGTDDTSTAGSAGSDAAAVEAAAGIAAPRPVPVGTAASGGGRGDPLRMIGVLALAGLAAVLWVIAGRGGGAPAGMVSGECRPAA